MREVTVLRGKLLQAIKENREKHEQRFLDAQFHYRETAIAHFECMLKDAREGRNIRRSISIPEPSNHTADYDRVITMLEMSIDDSIVIGAGEFENFVMDRWPWSANFNQTTAFYLDCGGKEDA